MAEATCTYLLLKRLPWQQANSYPVPWNQRQGTEGGITVDDHVEADELNGRLRRDGISTARSPMHAESDAEPTALTTDVRLLESKPIRAILKDAAAKDAAVHDQRYVGEYDLADGEPEVVVTIYRPSPAA